MERGEKREKNGERRDNREESQKRGGWNENREKIEKEDYYRIERKKKTGKKRKKSIQSESRENRRKSPFSLRGNRGERRRERERREKAVRHEHLKTPGMSANKEQDQEHKTSITNRNPELYRCQERASPLLCSRYAITGSDPLFIFEEFLIP